MSDRVQILVLSFLGAGACVVLTRATPAIAQTVQAIPYVHLQATTPGTAQSGNANLTGTVKAGILEGNGASINGLNASNVLSGTLPDARLSSNIPRLNGNSTFSGVNNFSNVLNSFAGDGQLLSNMNASNLGSGTVPDARLSVGGDVTGPLSNSTVTRIRGRSLSAIAPADGNVLKFSGSSWIPSTDEELNLPFSETVNWPGTAFVIENTGSKAIRGISADDVGVYGQVGSASTTVTGHGVIGSSTLAGKNGVYGRGLGPANGGQFESDQNIVTVAGATRCMTISGSIYREFVANTYRAVVPLAYGVVSGAGVVQSGTGNFTVTRTSTGVYEITVSGEPYNSTTHVVNVTVTGNSPRFASVAEVVDAFRVNVWTDSGSLTDLAFHFTMWGQPTSGK